MPPILSEKSKSMQRGQRLTPIKRRSASNGGERLTPIGKRNSTGGGMLKTPSEWPITGANGARLTRNEPRRLVVSIPRGDVGLILSIGFSALFRGPSTKA